MFLVPGNMEEETSGRYVGIVGAFDVSGTPFSTFDLAKRLTSDELLFSDWQKNNILEQILRPIQFCLHVCLCICVFLMLSRTVELGFERVVCYHVAAIFSVEPLGSPVASGSSRLTILQVATFRRQCFLPNNSVGNKGHIGLCSYLCLYGGRRRHTGAQPNGWSLKDCCLKCSFFLVSIRIQLRVVIIFLNVQRNFVVFLQV